MVQRIKTYPFDGFMFLGAWMCSADFLALPHLYKSWTFDRAAHETKWKIYSLGGMYSTWMKKSTSQHSTAGGSYMK